MYKIIGILIAYVLSNHLLFAAPQINGFSYTAVLSEAKTSLRQLDLPVAVYQKMHRNDYGDLRIFNSDGQIVPHQFSTQEREILKQDVSLTFFPFSKEQATNPENIRIIINQEQGKRSLEINQQLGGKTEAVKNEFQYIIRNADKSMPLCQLKLDWEQSQPSMILPFTLESSSDLQNWKTLGRKLSVSKLNYAGSQLVNNKVRFSCSSQKYLRLTWLKPKQSIHLKGLAGQYIENGKTKILWSNLGKPQYDDKNNLVFESDVISRISGMKFSIPQDGLLFKGVLYSRNSKKSAWKYRKAINQYRLNMGDVQLQSEAIVLNQIYDKYWKLELSNESQFTPDQLPEIHIAWRSRQLQFLAQGKEPFIIAFGNSSIDAVYKNDLNALMQSLKNSGASIDQVTFGEIKQNKEVVKAKEEIPWKLVLLWLVLILGTGLMAFMAYRLYQQMSQEKTGN